MSRVGIVTDSTCDLGPGVLAELDVALVPLKVLFGEDSFLDWVELAPDDFYTKLAGSPVLPKTSQPSPAEFLATYTALKEQGCDEIVSIHLSGALSGTMASALMAADESPVPVHCVDTRNVSQALGLVVRAAAGARDKGLSAAEVAEYATKVSSSLTLLFMLDTLEYLVKGGRAGKAQGLAASVLGIKPVLTVNSEGIIEPFKKVKGRKRGISEMTARVVADAEHGPLTAALLHGCVATGADELRSEVEASGADVTIVSEGTVGAVIGTYAGPGAIGIAYYPSL